MKRLLVILMMTMVPVISFAQKGIPRSNNVSVGVKRVTETTVEKVEKDYKTYDAKVGFQQMVGLNLGLYWVNESPSFGLSYVGGYRFNDLLFAGGGVEFNAEFDRGEFYVPIYIQISTCFTKRIWRPYVSLSLGGFARRYIWFDICQSSPVPESGYDGGFYADFSVGVDGRINEKLNTFVSFGINNMGFQLKTGLSF